MTSVTGIKNSSLVLVIGVLASMAEFERELVKERTELKREACRANGTSRSANKVESHIFPVSAPQDGGLGCTAA